MGRASGKVLIGGLNFEVNSFTPGTTGIEVFRAKLYEVGTEMFGDKLAPDEVTAALDVFRDTDFELVPLVRTHGGAGSLMRHDAYLEMKSEFMDALRGELGGCCAVYLTMHGAMATDQLDDPEGDFLTGVREIVGEALPVVASYDMHAVFTDAMAEATDASTGFRTCPHVDFYETGHRAATILLRLLTEPTLRLHTHHEKLALATTAEVHDTNTSPMKDFYARALELEQLPGVVAVDLYANQPWIDVPDAGWSILVVTEDLPELGSTIAAELRSLICARREELRVEKFSPEVALAMAAKAEAGPVYLINGSDSPSAGSTGDCVDLLSEILRQKWSGSALLSVTDSTVVDAAIAAGVGGTFTSKVGGTLSPRFFSPTEAEFTVVSLHPGDYDYIVPAMPSSTGPIAVLRVLDGVKVIATTRKASMVDDTMFTHVELDPNDFEVVQIKSAGGYASYFGIHGELVVPLDTPGPADSKLERLPFQHVRRPLWPLDADAPC